MDRLVEVNKVASLMRRRESARQIPTANLICRGLTARHDFADLIPTSLDSAPQLLTLHPAAHITTGVVRSFHSGVDTKPPAVRGREQASRIHDQQMEIVPGGGAPPRLPARRHSLNTSFPRHGATAVNLAAADVAGDTRDFVKLAPPSEIRTHLGDGPAMLRQLRRVWQDMTLQACAVRTTAAEGNALRVSIGLGFKIPPVRQHGRRVQPRMSNTLLAAERAVSLNGANHDTPVAVRPLTVPMPEIAVKLPGGPKSSAGSGFNPCLAVTGGGRVLRDMPPLEQRTSQVRWATTEPALRRTSLSQSGSGFARRNGARLARITLQPNLTQAAPQMGVLPFVAREDYCVPTIPYCNVLAGASSDGGPSEPTPAEPQVLGPVAVPPTESVRYEENFDAGWDNWVGGVSDWKVDIAGVRTGSLALYLPTLDLSDYDLEFLARIDVRSVNWMVRAAGADSHVRCTVTSVEGGELEFSRALVQGGTPEANVISATRVPGKPRTTFTVRMSVSGPVFSISIDGKMIDSWVDDRLATGGIGFMGAADDRARLYWVRVGSPGTPSKEHTAK
jgi:hypothetical protein